MNRSRIISWKIARVAVFTAMAVLIFVFPDFFTNYAAFAVGSVMILFAVDDLVRIKFMHGNFTVFPTGINSLVSIFLAVLMMIFLYATGTNTEHLIKVCVIWAVWSVIQQAYEVYEMCEYFREKKLGIVSIVESAAIIVLSVMLLIDPEEHIRLHMIILGVELLLKNTFLPLYELISRAKQRKKAV